MNVAVRCRLLLSLLALLLLSACATTNDPLKHTRKLVKEGHVSLYNNGAFKVPNTELTLIPAGPSALELAAELAGIRARQSFLTAIDRASQSVTVVAEGTKMTYHLAGDLHEGSGELAEAIKARSREGSKLLVYRSSEVGKAVIGQSWQLSKDLFQQGGTLGEQIGSGSQQAGSALAAGGTAAGQALARGSLSAAGEWSQGSRERSAAAFGFAGKSFIRGYATVPARIKERGIALGDNLDAMNPLTIGREENGWRQEWSQKSVDLLSNTVNHYGGRIADSFHKAGAELDSDRRENGVSLAALKSLRWVLKGLFWDTVIEPTAKVTTAALGYVAVNAVAYPTMVVVKEGVATTGLALEVSWDAARTGYDLVAPSATAAVAGIYSVLDFSGSHLAAGGAAVAGPAVGYGTVGASQVVGVTVKGAGYAAGKGVQYIGVPLASAGVAVGGGTVGAAVTTAGTVSGGTLFVTGETGAVATEVFGNVLAGTTLVGGTAASAATGTTLGVYELSKAVIVPTGYELGSGIVLSYGTLSHLGAHSILAVSDASYMVLSLEGPRWVLYAVTGKLDDGADLPPGTVLDLKKMQAGGEEFVNLQVADAEMQAVVESVYENLPVTE